MLGGILRHHRVRIVTRGPETLLSALPPRGTRPRSCQARYCRSSGQDVADCVDSALDDDLVRRVMVASFLDEDWDEAGSERCSGSAHLVETLEVS